MKDKFDTFAMFCFVALLTLWLGNIILYFQIQEIKQGQNNLIEQLKTKDLGIVDIFYYTNVPSMTDNTPNTMANNENVFEGAIAISRDLQDFLQFGDRVKLAIKGQELKTYIVSDLMNKRHRRSVDIFLNNTKENKKMFNRRLKGRLYGKE